MNSPTLYIFSGLPGSGKTTLARQLAAHLQATYLRIDTVEQELRDLCDINVEGEGYRLSYRIACDNLELGVSVIADSCNPIQLTRGEWQDVAHSVDAKFVDIEISCSDATEHRKRVETRHSTIDTLRLPNWEQVRNREYEPWAGAVISIDTAGESPEASFQKLLNQLNLKR